MWPGWVECYSEQQDRAATDSEHECAEERCPAATR